MALSASVIYEVRPGAGSDNNGGGFDPSVSSPGTDFSQQNSPQYSFSDGTATGTTAFTSASHLFVSADTGNCININSGSGFTASVYTIVSVSSGTATLDRSPGTGTAAVWKLGGAFAAFAGPIGFGNTFTNSPITVYVKGSLTLTSTLNLTTTSLVLIGYGTVRGDSGQATLTTATNSTALGNLNGTGTLVFSNFILSNTATTRAAVLINSNSFYTVNLQFKNCLINGVSTLADFGSTIAVDPLVLINTEIKNTTGASITCGGSSTQLWNIIMEASYAHSSASDALFLNSNGGCFLLMKDSVVAANAGMGLHLASGTNRTVVLNSMFYENIGDAIQLSSAASASVFMIVNNIFYGQTAWGINKVTLNAIPILNVMDNAFGGNSSGAHTGISTTGDVTLSGDPTFSGTTGNFQLNNNAGQGAACKRTAFQSTLVG
jgi:hypothetical protein